MTPDETAGYQAAVAHVWARGRQYRPGNMPSIDGDARDEGAPADATPEFLVGWRAGIDAARWS